MPTKVDQLLRNSFNTFYYYIRDTLVDKGWVVSGTFQGIATLTSAFPTQEDIERIVTREKASGEEDEIILPVIAVLDNNVTKVPMELGGTAGENHLQYFVLIFAEDDSQRRDLSNELFNELFEKDTDLLDFQGGYPPTIVPSGYGQMEFSRVTLSTLRAPNNSDVAERHRANISLNALVYESN